MRVCLIESLAVCLHLQYHLLQIAAVRHVTQDALLREFLAQSPVPASVTRESVIRQLQCIHDSDDDVQSEQSILVSLKDPVRFRYVLTIECI